MKSLKKSYEIDVSIGVVWKALVYPKEIEGWDAGPAEMDEKEDTKFKLWGGDIFGTNTKIVINKLLKQDWYGGKWPEPSKVEISLKEKDNKTVIQLIHTNIPDNEYSGIKNGWDDYYFGPMKNYLESR